MIYTLPATFVLDHLDRCDGPGERRIVRQGARTVTVELDAVALGDLKSDCRHYMTAFGPEDSEYAYRVLRPSAARTLRALDRGSLEGRSA